MIGFVEIIFTCLLISLAVFFLALLGLCCNDWSISKKGFITASILFVLCFAITLPTGISIDINSHRVFVASHNAQKYTIEQSLRNSALSGFERVELVKQASELNSELAERKARIQQWNYFHVDDSIYDGVEYIILEV